MFGKPFFFAITLFVAATAPYVCSKYELLEPLKAKLRKVESAERSLTGSSTTPRQARESGATLPVSHSTSFKPPLAEPEVVAPALTNKYQGIDLPLTHLLSFEVTPDWVRENWESVTNCAGELGLQGWRVAYFQASPESDFAGSVTYYFDKERRVQRILLHGYSSDPSGIVQLATSHYQMRRIPGVESDLYVARLHDRPVGGLSIEFCRLLNAGDRDKQCEVLLELNRQRSEYGMSREFERLLNRNQKANKLLEPAPNLPFTRLTQ